MSRHQTWCDSKHSFLKANISKLLFSVTLDAYHVHKENIKCCIVFFRSLFPMRFTLISFYCVDLPKDENTEYIKPKPSQFSFPMLLWETPLDTTQSFALLSDTKCYYYDKLQETA